MTASAYLGIYIVVFLVLKGVLALSAGFCACYHISYEGDVRNCAFRCFTCGKSRNSQKIWNQIVVDINVVYNWCLATDTVHILL